MLRKFLCLVSAGCCLCFISAPSRAEVFLLRKGKVIHGKWLNNDEEKPSQYRIETLDGFEIAVDAKDVEKIEQPSPNEKKYLDNINKIDDTTAGHENLVKWLEKEGMTQLANAHRERPRPAP